GLYEGGVRIPLVAWGPGRVRPGTTDRPTPLTDGLPTLAELAGAPAPADVDGLSAAPLLAGGPDAARHGHLYWFRDELGVTSRANAQDAQRATWLAEAVRRENWKAVRFAPERDHALPDAKWQVELYDLAADPGETRDLAATYPARAAELVALMRSSWQSPYPRTPFGTRLTLPALAVPGQAFTVTATLDNGSSRPWTDAGLGLTAPAGWTVTATSPATAQQLPAGARLTASWQVTPPAGAAPATAWTLTAEGTALAPGGLVRYPAKGSVPTPPPPPTRDSYLSDLAWISATNGWGPVERDASNGKNAAGDGPPISFGGTTYPKGLGVHAPSEIAYHLGGTAVRFTALVGIDDFSARQSALGATRAKVYGDGRPLLTTPTLTAAGGPVAVDLDVRGVRVLRLVVEDANDRSSFDHTSWALARVTVA
ncbi:NPCBM/NEW2 domain-containing protein, partial [Streptomyces sp. NPDC058157]|uniref:NPCBM/NEW2 domain-containing protein n=1 Tax=Streptomyces sp. NPDC058157 TaxID=3346360 RepID=UPI0036E7200B